MGSHRSWKNPPALFLSVPDSRCRCSLARPAPASPAFLTLDMVGFLPWLWAGFHSDPFSCTSFPWQALGWKLETHLGLNLLPTAGSVPPLPAPGAGAVSAICSSRRRRRRTSGDFCHCPTCGPHAHSPASVSLTVFQTHLCVCALHKVWGKKTSELILLQMFGHHCLVAL